MKFQFNGRRRPAILAATVLFALVAPAYGEPRWRLQYAYDKDKSNLILVDIKFSSPQRGIAVGVLEEKKKTRPASLVTNDGGAHWTELPLPDSPRSVFLLNDAAGWMVGESGIWFTSEAGRNWKRIYKNKVLGRVYFRDAEHGYAIGGDKTVLETSDGGQKWVPLEAAKEPSTTADHTTYNWVDFWNPKNGLIVGHTEVGNSSKDRIPLWMDPNAEFRRELPSITLFLQTLDGGATWKTSQSSAFGNMVRFTIGPDGRGLALINYENYFRYPSEVLRLDNKTKEFTSVFKQPDRLITDVTLGSNGGAFAAGIERTGMIANSPIPGKVKILQTDDLQNWTEQKVDYRATARRVQLAQSGSDVWAATDTGMILKLSTD